MKIPSDIRNKLNKKYISEVPVTISVKIRYSDFFSNHSLFIKTALDRGSCLTLHDIDFRLSASGFWNTETFEDHSKYLFWTFSERFLGKLLNRIEELNLQDIRFFIGVIRENPEPYLWVIDHPTDPYLFFCGNKLKSLNKKHYLDRAYETDRQNRITLLKHFKNLEVEKSKTTSHSKTLESAKASVKKLAKEKIPAEQPPKEEIIPVNTTEEGLKENVVTEAESSNIVTEIKPTPGKPFTALLKDPEIKQKIQEHLTEAGIPFAVFQKVKLVGNNRNPDGFNSAVAAMIVVFRELGYFKEGAFFGDILDAYLKETRNSIGKLSYFKRHYREATYFQNYKRDLLDLQLTKFQ